MVPMILGIPHMEYRDYGNCVSGDYQRAPQQNLVVLRHTIPEPELKLKNTEVSIGWGNPM